MAGHRPRRRAAHCCSRSPDADRRSRGGLRRLQPDRHQVRQAAATSGQHQPVPGASRQPIGQHARPRPGLARPAGIEVQPLRQAQFEPLGQRPARGQSATTAASAADQWVTFVPPALYRTWLCAPGTHTPPDRRASSPCRADLVARHRPVRDRTTAGRPRRTVRRPPRSSPPRRRRPPAAPHRGRPGGPSAVPGSTFSAYADTWKPVAKAALTVARHDAEGLPGGAVDQVEAHADEPRRPRQSAADTAAHRRRRSSTASTRSSALCMPIDSR